MQQYNRIACGNYYNNMNMAFFKYTINMSAKFIQYNKTRQNRIKIRIKNKRKLQWNLKLNHVPYKSSGRRPGGTKGAQ